MKLRKAPIYIGAFAAVVAAAIFANHGTRDASAQQSTIQNQADDQTQIQSDRPQNQRPLTTRRSADPNKRGWKASELVGMDVRGITGDDEIGEISDVMIGPDGKIVYVAVSFGGFLGLGDKLFAVPWKGIQFVREGKDVDDVYARIDVTEEQLRTRRGFNQDNWPTQADESFLPEASRVPRQVERPRPSARTQDVQR